ncbi:MAG: 2-oxoacid:acceptor oxidoreductase family protein [Candidatus Omnitrophota bacterium]|nr:2-oxoacid:acceptor oxidoreductase family protein [Candidatus Omnitrophota bacterium]
MLEKIIIAGSGGQGIMLLGKVLAETAMQENKFVTWLPAYGAEVRGGTAYCMVVISDTEIGSPYIDKADTLIIMNSLALEKFKNRIKKNGFMFINTSLIKNNLPAWQKMLKYPFSDIAKDIGNIKIANMVALGCYLANKKILNKEKIPEVFKIMAPTDKKELVLINQKAFLKGLELK